MFLSQANRFCFGLKILGQSKAIWFGLEIVLGKIERFYIIQKLKDRNKMFWFGPLIIGTKAKRFNLFQNYLNWIGTFWRFLKYFKSDRIKYCEYTQLWRLETTTEIDGTAFRLMNATASKSYSNRRQQLLPWPIFCQIGPLKAVVKLFKVRKIGDKLIFFLKYWLPVSTIRGVDDSPLMYQWCGESTAPRIYEDLFKKYLEEGGLVL
jgi:hypothetical protein